MSYEITRKVLSPEPVLVERRRVAPAMIGATIGEVVGKIFQYAQQHGFALTGKPITRYLDMGMGHMTIEPGMRIAALAEGEIGGAPDDEDVEGVRRDVLPGGSAASTIHSGPYETLNEAYAAIEAWMQAEGVSPAGAPWDSYITDPAEFPDPQDWKTEVIWPIE